MEWRKTHKVEMKKKEILRRSLQVFWKFHAGQAFRLLKGKIRREKILQDKNKIDGAYLLMDDLRGHLKKLDKALEKMWKEKSDRSEFEMLKLSVDETRAKTIFNDMKELFETTMAEHVRSMNTEK